MSYLVSDGLGPYFNQISIREIVEWHFYFTLQFDQTVRAQVKKKQEDYGVKIKYLTSSIVWSNKGTRCGDRDIQGIR